MKTLLKNLILIMLCMVTATQSWGQIDAEEDDIIVLSTDRDGKKIYGKNTIKVRLEAPVGATNFQCLYQAVLLHNRSYILTGVDTDPNNGEVCIDGGYSMTYTLGGGQSVAVFIVPQPDLYAYDTLFTTQSSVTLNLPNPTLYDSDLVYFAWLGEASVFHSGASVTIDGLSSGITKGFACVGYGKNNGDISKYDTTYISYVDDFSIPTSATLSGGTATIGEVMDYNPTYSWTGPSSFTSSEATPTVTVAGDYTVTATWSDGFELSHTITVSNETLEPTVNSVSVNTTPSCLGTELTITADVSNLGSYTLQYEYNGTSFATGTNLSETHTPSATGTHTYTVKVMDGGTVKDSDNTTAVVYEKDAFNPSVDTNIVQGDTYSINLPNDGSTWELNSVSASGTITVTDGDVLDRTHVCGNESYTFNIHYYEAWETWSPTLDHVVCNGVTPNVTITRPANADVILKTSTGVVISGDIQLTSFGEHQIRVYHYDIDYDLVVYQTYTFDVSENPVLNVATQITDVKYCDGETITPNALASGGAGGYSYAWSNGLTQGVEGTLPVGSHTLNVTVTDDAGCTATDSKAVTVYDNPTVNVLNTVANSSSNVNSCEGETINLSADGTFVSYSWSNLVTGVDNIDVTTTNTYGVTVTDANGCEASDNIVVTFNELPNAELGPALDGCGSVNVVAPYDADYAYVWNTTEETQSITVTESGKYKVTVTDKGCSSTDSVDVTVNEAPDATISGDLDFCYGTQTTLSVPEVSGNTYSWTLGNTNIGTDATCTITNAQITSIGSNKVTVTVDNGCTLEETITLYVSGAVLEKDTVFCDNNIPGNWINNGDGTYTLRNSTGCDSITWVVDKKIPGEINVSWDGDYVCLGDVLQMQRPLNYKFVTVEGAIVAGDIDITVSEKSYGAKILLCEDYCGNDIETAYTLHFPKIDHIGFLKESVDINGTGILNILNLEDNSANLPTYLQSSWTSTNSSVKLNKLSVASIEVNMQGEKTATIKVDISNSCNDSGKSGFVNSVQDEINISNTSVGIQDILFAKTVNIYPNPVKDKLFVKISSEEDIENIEIRDITGKLVKSFANTTALIGEIPAGYYLMHIKTISGKSAVKKFIKE